MTSIHVHLELLVVRVTGQAICLSGSAGGPCGLPALSGKMASGQVEKEILMQVSVKSVVIDWQAETLEIKSQAGATHTIALDKDIHVVMVGYPDREEQTFPARNLGRYMSRGYIIEQISFEVED